jgi:hypothetical protein
LITAMIASKVFCDSENLLVGQYAFDDEASVVHRADWYRTWSHGAHGFANDT